MDGPGVVMRPGSRGLQDEVKNLKVEIHDLRAKLKKISKGQETIENAGRAAVLTLDPLSVRERLQQAQMTPETLLERVFTSAARTAGNDEGQTSDLVEWLLRGGFPEPCVNKQADRRLWFSSYVQTYLERDVRDLTQVSSLRAGRTPGARLPVTWTGHRR